MNTTERKELYEKLHKLVEAADKAWQDAYNFAAENGLPFNMEDMLPTQNKLVEEENWKRSQEHWSAEDGWEYSNC